jgi:hypothetical protein
LSFRTCHGNLVTAKPKAKSEAEGDAGSACPEQAQRVEGFATAKFYDEAGSSTS